MYSQFFLMIALIVRSDAITDDFCADGTFDAITELKNGSVVIFKGSNVWEFDAQQLSGPFPIKDKFDEMKGPIDAAVTIGIHPSVMDFNGASIYFQGEEFYTYKNFRPYQIEWGTLVYMPHKGPISKIGSINQKIESLMNRKLLAAYFDPNDSTTNLIFTDSSVLSYTFELGYKYDKPIISDINTKLSRFGLQENITVTGAYNNLSKRQLYLFQSKKYCAINMTVNAGEQQCRWAPTKTLFKCDSVKPLPEQPPVGGQTDKVPIQGNATSQETRAETAPEPKGEAGQEMQISPTTKTPGNSANGRVLSLLSILLFSLLLRF